MAFFGEAAAQQFQHSRFIFNYEQFHKVSFYHTPVAPRKVIAHHLI